MQFISKIFKGQKADLEYLIELGKELKTQDNLGTRKPLIFRIMEDVNVQTCEELSDYFQLIIDSEEKFEDGDEARAKEYLLKNISGFDIEVQNELKQCENLWEVVEFCEKYKYEYDIFHEVLYFSRENQFSGEFLTRKAAKEHLEKYSYRFSQDARIYCDCAAENEELTKLTEILERLYEINKGSDEELGEEKQKEKLSCRS